jgi:predicted nucleotidyltransferase
MHESVANLRGQIDELCRKHRVRQLELFGSAVAGNFDPTSSDLDFLVEFAPFESGEYSDHYFGLLEDLGELFGRPVDLVVSRAIRNPYFLQSIKNSRDLLYAA